LEADATLLQLQQLLTLQSAFGLNLTEGRSDTAKVSTSRTSNVS